MPTPSMFHGRWSSPGRKVAVTLALFAGAIVFAGPAAAAADEAEQGGAFCTRTARLLFQACSTDTREESLIAKAKCINVADPQKRSDCFGQIVADGAEARQLCEEQQTWRLEACGSLGERRYDPDFRPANFDADFHNPAKTNPYFPLTIGNTWQFSGGDETNTLEVLDRTKLIDGVTCVVMRDTVLRDGRLHEDTDDWYAQARNGAVWYCGEEVKNYETFDGDGPMRAELVSVDGSFKAGRNGDKPGVIFLASPKRGATYLEEFSLGNAEDATTILATAYGFGKFPKLDHRVPQALADRLCNEDCVVTKNISLLEPDIYALKYYARGIGFFLEVTPKTGEVTQLVGCSFDSRCAGLPTP